MALNDRPVTPEINLVVNQGDSYSRVLSWAVDPVVQKNIVSITQAAPPVLNVVGHGLIAGWPIWIEDVVGMREINNPFGDGETPVNDPYIVAVTDADHITIPGLSTLLFGAYLAGGSLRYFTPHDLAGYTAKMQLRKPKTDATVILELTDANGGVILDNTAKTITIQMTAVQTAALTKTDMEYDLKLTSGSGVVTRIAQGRVDLSIQVTK